MSLINTAAFFHSKTNTLSSRYKIKFNDYFNFQVSIASSSWKLVKTNQKNIKPYAVLTYVWKIIVNSFYLINLNI